MDESEESDSLFTIRKAAETNVKPEEKNPEDRKNSWFTRSTKQKDCELNFRGNHLRIIDP